MKLDMQDMNTIKGLIHYLNDSFDGHGLIVRVDLVGERPDGEYLEPSKGEIVVDTNVDGTHTYAWRGGEGE